MSINTKFRSTAPELMDDFEMKGDILRDALDKIANINKLLGGNKVTLDGIKTLLKNKPKTQLLRITDIGCGNGDMLRTLADYADKNNLNFSLTGIDANQFTIDTQKVYQKIIPISLISVEIFLMIRLQKNTVTFLFVH